MEPLTYCVEQGSRPARRQPQRRGRRPCAAARCGDARALRPATGPASSVRRPIHLNPFTARAVSMGTQPPEDDVEPLTYTVDEAADLLGVARSVAYEAVRNGSIPATRVGRRWLIPRQRFHDWLNGMDPAGSQRDGDVQKPP